MHTLWRYGWTCEKRTSNTFGRFSKVGFLGMYSGRFTTSDTYNTCQVYHTVAFKICSNCQRKIEIALTQLPFLILQGCLPVSVGGHVVRKNRDSHTVTSSLLLCSFRQPHSLALPMQLSIVVQSSGNQAAFKSMSLSPPSSHVPPFPPPCSLPGSMMVTMRCHTSQFTVSAGNNHRPFFLS